MQRVAQLVFQTNLREFESLRRYQAIADFRLSICDWPLQEKAFHSTRINRQSAIRNRKCLMWVVAQLTEHRTVTAVCEGSTPFDPPKSLPIVDFRLSIDGRIDDKSAIGNWKSKISWNCGREVRHLIVDQADDGSSPFSSAMRQ